MKDGGPAFACTQANTNSEGGWEGMSLRDYFAGQICAWAWLDGRDRKTDLKLSNEEIAKACYELADAMLAQRDKSPSDMKMEPLL